MRYEKGHKAATRARIVDIASRRYRAEGIEAVGVASLMADAQLTHGGFYSHFASKEDLVRSAVTEGFEKGHAALAEAAAAGENGLEGMIAFYLRPDHRARPERGCLAASLVSEIARHPEPTREVFTDKLGDRIALIADYLPAVPEHRRYDRAMAIFAAIMGALQLARAVTDPALSDALLANGAKAALAIARLPDDSC